MTLDDAYRLLHDPKYIREKVQEAAAQLEVVPTMTVNPDDLPTLRGTVNALHIILNLFAIAEATIEEAQREERTSEGEGPLPLDMVGALLSPEPMPAGEPSER